MLSKSLTIVLPVHNAEARLRACVGEILDLASELTAHFGVLIIDDGSTDSTYEVAQELAARYPQVALERHRHRRGLGPTIDDVQRNIRSDAVIVHDGVAPIDPNQVRSLWRCCLGQVADAENGAITAALQSDVCDFANLPAIHAALEQAHQRVLGFQWITPSTPAGADSTDASGVDPTRPRTDTSHSRRRGGMGQIPPLPRPKFRTSLADFALGE